MGADAGAPMLGQINREVPRHKQCQRLRVDPSRTAAKPRARPLPGRKAPARRPMPFGRTIPMG